nr:hypothetical protein [Tanacetum cinerariifolium]
MTTLADKAILLGADNRPPMLEKDMYDSWKSIMELYMMNRQHGRMILESIKTGLLIWPTIEENGVTRPKKYYELSAMEAIQGYYDGRIIEELDKDEDVNLVSVQREVQETTKTFKDDDDATLTETLLNIKRSSSKDKGKGIMQETELQRS